MEKLKPRDFELLVSLMHERRKGADCLMLTFRSFALHSLPLDSALRSGLLAPLPKEKPDDVAIARQKPRRRCQPRCGKT